VSLPVSLRARLLIGAALWTIGLFGLTAVGWHVLLGYRQPPRFFLFVFDHPAAFSIVCAICLAAGLIQVRRGWSPINQLRARLIGLREGRERRLEGEYPTEVEPLVGDLNALLDQRERTVERARAKAGDLAHGLKTPLAVLAQEAERASAAGQLDLAVSIRQQVERMRRQVDYQLAQARVEASGQAPPSSPISVEEAAGGLARTLLRLHADRGLTIAVEVGSDLHVRVDREDLDEMLGNLLDNACKWARRRAAISAVRDGDRIVLMVDDDGPGIDASMRTTVLERGVRADEVAPGSGLGLSIARDIAHAYGGSVSLDGSPSGGTRAKLTLPAG
jgi:signal transduction histidine kinase